MVGKHKGLVSLLKKELDAKEIRHDTLIFCHCIIHQQSLCAKSVKFDHVISVVTDCINFIKKRDLNNRIFKQVLKDYDADYDDLLYYCAVRWTSCGNMLARFYSLQPARWSSGNAFVTGVGGLRFKSRADQIEHSVANGSPPLRHFFERSCVARAQ